MKSGTSVIQTNKLSKRYGTSEYYAVSDLDISVAKGEIYGFLGPNGSGKSTTIRLLLNFIQPTSGSAKIFGKDIVANSVNIRKNLGYLSGEVALYLKMTGRQFLRYMSELQPPKNQQLQDELIKRFQADVNVPIRSLSKGNRQKIGIIQAFMHEPEILILDEPTGGLDPLMQEEFFRLIHETKQRGASVFVSSHNLAEVQKVCDRVGFIREGKLIAEQNIATLDIGATKTFDITFKDKAPLKDLKALPKTEVEPVSPHQVTIHIKGDLSSMFGVLASNKVTAINQREISVEHEFLRYYSGGNQ